MALGMSCRSGKHISVSMVAIAFGTTQGVIALLAACSSDTMHSRSHLSGTLALVGHWLQDSPEDRVHFCFSPEGIQIIYSEAEGQSSRSSYQAEELTSHTVRWTMPTEKGNLDRLIQFPDDKLTAAVYLPPLEQPYASWRYVDDNFSGGCDRSTN